VSHFFQDGGGWEKPVQFCSSQVFSGNQLTAALRRAAVVLATGRSRFWVDGDALAVGTMAAFNVEVVAEGGNPGVSGVKPGSR